MREGNALELSPSILDASVFSSYHHCETLLSARKQFFVSETLYTILYKEYKREKVFDILRYFVWRPLEYLPMENLDLQPYLKRYRFNEKYIEEVYPYYKKSLLPQEVKKIILDEYSFLKEHSSILMASKRIARHLHKWGIILVDATNKFYDRKQSFFHNIRGVRWLIGFSLAATGIARFAQDSVAGTIVQAGGAAILLLDP